MKLNLSLIDKDPVLRSRLKDAALESVRDFFPDREPPEEAVEYVVAALCLGETKEEFERRLQLLFEKDCTSIVNALDTFVQTHQEFTTTSESEVKRNVPKSTRQKIVWNALSEKPSENEEEKTKPSKTESETPQKTKKANPNRKAVQKIIVAPKPKDHRTRENVSQGSKQKKVPIQEDGSFDRWQPNGDPDKDAPPMPHDAALDPSSARNVPHKVPRSRLFETALGGIKQQFKKQESSGDESRTEKRNPVKSKNEMRPNDVGMEANLPHASLPGALSFHHRQDPVFVADSFSFEPESIQIEPEPFPLPVQRESSILDRIRKPDGSEFEEWEFVRDPSRTKKRQAEERPKALEAPAEMSEVESLKLKIARLEKEVHNVQASHSVPYPLPPRPYPHDFDLCSVCVKNVHYMANEEVVAAHFHSCQPILRIDFAKDPYGQPKGFCFIQFSNERSVQQALELDKSLLLGRNITVVRKLSRPPMQISKPMTGMEWKKRQWIPGALPSRPTPLREEWNNGTELDAQEIQDFTIDTGSQEMP